MQTIITRACNELGIKPIPSKRVSNGRHLLLCFLEVICAFSLLQFT